MPNEDPAPVRIALTKTFSSLAISKIELRQLCDRLQERNLAAGEFEIARLEQLQQSDSEFEETKRLLLEGFELLIRVEGTDGESLFGTIPDVFDSVNFPDDVKTIILKSRYRLSHSYNFTPSNWFELLVDFSRPRVFDFNVWPSQATPNASTFSVNGEDPTWANGVFQEASRSFDRLKTSFGFLHKHSVYDLFLWLIAVPFGFRLCFLLAQPIESFAANISPFVLSAGYLYVFVIVLFGFRFIFHYARWVFPKVEYVNERGRIRRHRIVLFALVTGVVAPLLIDIAKYLLA